MKYEAELSAIEMLAKMGACHVRVGDVEVWLGPPAVDEPAPKLETDEEIKRRLERDMFYSAGG